MIPIHRSLARIMEAIGRTLGAGTSAPDAPPPGWLCRTTRLSNGYLISVEGSLDPVESGYVLLEHQRIVRETKDRIAPLSHFTPRPGVPHPTPSGSPKPVEVGVPDPCPLLVDFLARRARR